MSTEVQGVLFDMDDTLIDWSGVDGEWAVRERQHLKFVYDYLSENKRPLRENFATFALNYRNEAMSAWEEARTTLRAPHIMKVMETTLAGCGFHPDNTITMRDVMVAYRWGGVEGVRVFPDVPEALQTLIDRGVKIGIVTNAFQPMWLREAELHDFDLMQYFPEEKLRISAADVGYLKPHPNIFLHALRQMETKAQNTLYVGDNPVADITGSQGVGMRAVLRVNKETPPLTSRMVVPDATVKDFGQLLKLVEDWDAHAESA